MLIQPVPRQARPGREGEICLTPARGNENAANRRGAAGDEQGGQIQLRQTRHGIGIQKTPADFPTRERRLLHEENLAAQTGCLPGGDGSGHSSPNDYDVPNVAGGVAERDRFAVLGFGMNHRNCLTGGRT